MIEGPQERSRVLGAFAFLAAADPGFQDSFLSAASLAKLPAGQTLSRQGDACSHLALMIRGTVRVYRLGESGREITLYRVRPGESCVLTASCILRQGVFPGFAECETEVEAVLVSQQRVELWLRHHQPWRDFVFGLVSERLLEVISLLDALAFQRLDRRLARHLLAAPISSSIPSGIAAGDLRGGAIHITHQALAAELGSSREVVSRLLAAWEDRGLIKTARGQIQVLHPQGLDAIASGT